MEAGAAAEIALRGGHAPGRGQSGQPMGTCSLWRKHREGGLGLTFMSPSMFQEQRTARLRVQSGKSSRQASVSRSRLSLGLSTVLSCRC